jgi:hypothetical protein
MEYEICRWRTVQLINDKINKERDLGLRFMKQEDIAGVFRRDSPPTWSRRSAGSGGESSSMLTSVEGNAVQAF